MYFIVATLVFMMFFVSYRSRYGHLSPSTFFLFPWLVSLILLALPIYEYDQEIGVFSYLYLSLAIVVFVFGSRIVPLPKFLYHRYSGNGTPIFKLFPLELIGFLGFVGQLAVLYDSVVVHGLTISNLLSRSSLDIRDSYFDAINNIVLGPYVFIETLLSPFAFISVMFFIGRYYLRGKNSNSYLFSLLALSCCFLIFFNAVYVQGGRFNMLYITFLVIITIILSKARSRNFAKIRNNYSLSAILKRIGILFVSIILAWSLAVPYIEKRVRGVEPETVLHAAHRATFDPRIKALINDKAGYFFLSLSYATIAVPTLFYYMDLGDEYPGPYYGAYNFPFLFSGLKKLTGDGVEIREWVNIREDVFSPLVSKGYFPNVWATAIRDFISDFGYLVTLIVMFMFGFLAGYFYRNFLVKPNEISVSIVAAILFGSVWFSFHSPFFLSNYSLLVIYLLIIFLGNRLLKKGLA